ncbi:MAG: restriction endonuclease subunit S [Nitrospira sp.]|nr:restriction endonuclease subunit S [Nitrospira sp.]
MNKMMKSSGGDNGDLPHVWRQVALEEIASVLSGQSPPSATYRKEPDGLPFFQGKADFGRTSPTARVWCVAPKTIAKPGDILISVRAPVGPTNVADVECCIGRGLAAIRCGNSVERDFVLFFMKFHEHEISQMGTGSTFGAISRKHLLNIQVPLPPFPEQKRIVAVLNKQMAAVEVARGAALERVEAVRALPSAWLREVFSFGGGGLPRGWRWTTLNNVCIEDRCAIDGKSDDASVLPYLSLENIESMSGKIVFHAGKTSNSDIQVGVSNCFRFGPEHVLYGKLRPYLNKVALPDFSGRCTTEAIPILPKPEINREFLAWTLRRHETVDWAMAGKTGSRMPRTNMKHLMSFKFPLPPLTEQKRLVSALNAKMAATEKIRAAAEAELEAITALPAALLREAFSCVLGPCRDARNRTTAPAASR